MPVPRKVVFKGKTWSEMLTEEQRENLKEAEALHDAIALTPKRIIRRSTSPNSVCDYPSGVPPRPQKLRRERADDIVETAMRLMDMAMDQNRMIKKLEKVIEENYTRND